MPRTIPAIELVDVSLGDIEKIVIAKSGEDDSEIYVSVRYHVSADDGSVHHGGGYSAELPPSAKQEIVSWLTNRIIPEINSQEGM